MLPEDRIRITHMRDACESVSRFIVGKTTPDLADGQMLQFALVRAIEIIGEAAGRVLRMFKSQLQRFHGVKLSAFAIAWFMRISTWIWIFCGRPQLNLSHSCKSA
jgi:uncharacterized protein with HEPN domain